MGDNIFIMTRSSVLQSYLLKQIPRHTADIVTVTADRFKLSRQTIHKHLRKLIDSGVVVQVGHKKGAQYFLSASKKVSFSINLDGLKEDLVWKKYLEAKCREFPENVLHILHYGFTEMLNNAIDHSGGTHANCSLDVDGGMIKLGIRDNGIGVFQKIKNALDLSDLREGILHLTKGKFTTDASRHSGEGIFFTSRAFDIFELESNGLEYVRILDDWLMKSDADRKGTSVYFAIAANSPRRLEDVFRKFTDSETHRFDGTQVLVELGKLPGEHYVSRSQAKRVVLGLEKFRRVLLDFKRVNAVGQGFVDEVFRVFKNAHPGIEIRYQNANADVEFMIKRSL